MVDKFYFSQFTFDRAHHLRGDDDWLQTRQSHESARFIPMWRDRNLVRGGEHQPEAVMLVNAEAIELRDAASEVIFLGVDDSDTAYFAADLSHLDEPSGAALPDDASYEDLRAFAGNMDRDTAGLMAYARGLFYWHSNHLFCGKCGHPTLSKKAGHERACTNSECGRVHFPRTDPAVIMLITRGEGDNEVALLGRNKRFAGRGLRYSTLAGFVEPGESLEDAVAREVLEEANILTTDIRYQASQPWPFPASLMLGYRGRAISEEITYDPEELMDAQWFTKQQVREMDGEGGILPPSGLSISRWLIDTWLHE